MMAHKWQPFLTNACEQRYAHQDILFKDYVSLLASHGAKGSHDIQGEHECL